MSLACALAGLPGMIAYQAHPLTYAVARQVIRVPYIGIMNLLLGRALYPEFIQGEANPDRLSRALLECLSPGRREEALLAADELRATLAQPAYTSAAKRVLEFLGLPVYNNPSTDSSRTLPRKNAKAD